ncbi:lysylphosphatidylglycerol synthase transmembrane domain-containing protein [Nostocoides sp. HKS02]|uniref:lysylphosphatidylglycerol synthase transmembrane domain-containing protein n=1 Tax=Nostocoides sp. HKS02 TaxID=1813880 RepID=UPI0012B445E4|nr:lysylphosphatidylglycerol synthase transmembrane domain-containing protein [Tetrasphaera sp. HKS02]QGN57241.1 UPF0104 family protein [Tetrasphaera sp. HKS02]
MTTLTLPAAGWRVPAWVVRLLAGATVLAVVAWHVGTGPALASVRGLDARSMGAAAAIAVLTTACCAWRWTLVARAVGLDLRWRTALAAYYRSQFLNLTLPGGVVGDLHRGLHHGRAAGDVGRALRAVLLERTAGQAVQLAVTVAAVALLPSPVRPPAPVSAALIVLVALVLGTAVVLARRRPPAGPARWARIVRAVSSALRDAVLARPIWPAVALASVVVVAGHVLTFVIAARVVGSTAPTTQLVPLGLFVLLAMGVPATIAGWGPREGAAAWAFAAAGLTAAQGLGTAVAYGVLILVASLPGGAVALVGWMRDPHG